MAARTSACWLGALALLLPAACSEGGEGEVVRGAGSSGPRTDPFPEDPASFGALPDFALVSERGEPVTRASFLGHPLVLATLFTSCSGPCPKIARALASLQEELAATDVHFAAVSVDPEVDTP